MTRNILRVTVAALLAATLWGCSDPMSETPQWLRGEWILAHNPGNDDNDILRFHQGGRIEILTENGTVLNGDFVLRDRFLVINLSVNGRPVEATFTVAQDHSRLIYKTGAYYTRRN